jgi:hypothetical protein
LSILSRRGDFNQKLDQSGVAAHGAIYRFSFVSRFHVILLLTTLTPAMGAPLFPCTYLSVSLQKTEMEVSRQPYCVGTDLQGHARLWRDARHSEYSLDFARLLARQSDGRERLVSGRGQYRGMTEGTLRGSLVAGSFVNLQGLPHPECVLFRKYNCESRPCLQPPYLPCMQGYFCDILRITSPDDRKRRQCLDDSPSALWSAPTQLRKPNSRGQFG